MHSSENFSLWFPFSGGEEGGTVAVQKREQRFVYDHLNQGLCLSVLNVLTFHLCLFVASEA